MTIKIIACVDENYGLGYKGNLLFHISHDLKVFKEKTLGHYCIMGRRTYESLPNTLPNRTNVILTRNKHYKVDDYHVVIEHDIKQIINYYLNTGTQDKDLWCIGGEEIFKEVFPYTKEVYLTVVRDKANKCDTYFPYAYLDNFEEVDRIENWSDKYNCRYDFVTYKRKEDVVG